MKYDVVFVSLKFISYMLCRNFDNCVKIKPTFVKITSYLRKLGNTLFLCAGDSRGPIVSDGDDRSLWSFDGGEESKYPCEILSKYHSVYHTPQIHELPWKSA